MTTATGATIPTTDTSGSPIECTPAGRLITSRNAKFAAGECPCRAANGQASASGGTGDADFVDRRYGIS
jgi:hypothetical protein